MNQNNQINEDLIKIEYERANPIRVIFSNLLDFLLVSFLSLSIFIGVKKIFESSNVYVDNLNQFNTLKINSKLYIKDKDKIVDIVSYYEEKNDLTSRVIKNNLKEAINNFNQFMIGSPKVNNDNKKKIIEVYEEKLLEKTNTYLDKNTMKEYSLFVKYNEIIEENKEFKIPNKTYINFYKKYIFDIALAEFNGWNEDVLILNKYFSNTFIFKEVPISLVISLILYFYIIPLIFSRGKQTLGRLAFKIGVVNKELLSPSFLQYTLNFLLFFFLECMLSIVFLIPLIISFTMFLITINQQNFHNYMTNFNLIDVSNHKIYKNKDELAKDYYNINK
ncbi:MAG: RDD family protein [Bacillales bacterium]